MQLSLEKHKIFLIYGLSILFIVLNIFFIAKEFYWFSLVPLILLVLLLAFFSLDTLLFIVVFLTPLSINLTKIGIEIGGYDVGIAIPTEPILLCILILFVFKFLYNSGLDRAFYKHPITIAIIINIIWIAVTCIPSTIPIVSVKFLISRLWFVVAFYFLGVILLKEIKNIKIFLFTYIIPLIGIIIYTTIHHSQYQFEEEPAHWVMYPFFNDHTAYGAILAFFIPFLFGICFSKTLSTSIGTYRFKILPFIILAIFLIAMFLSYSRAAWVSLIGAFIVFLVIKFRIKFKYLLLFLIAIIIIFFSIQDRIIMRMEENRHDISSDFTEHFQSITNISTNTSNLERINRWKCAIRMFKEKPIFGWGPGTYMFKYGPFQVSYEKTIISTNVGDMGNAHSEYLGPLSESGILGILTFLLIIITACYTAIKLYSKSQDKIVRYIALVIFLGLVTYFLHGVMNNFLDTDKASVLFWGFLAILTALDLYHTKQAES